MRFTESEIQWAARLRGAGLNWDPQPGHYVFDINGVVKAGSPFQAGVYAVTSANVIETAAGGAEHVGEAFIWLPTWEDARDWLTCRRVETDEIIEALRRGLGDGITDRESLYQLILQKLDSSKDEGS